MSLPITVGLDGSCESLAAADWAAREALRRGLPLRLLHAWQWQPYAQAPLAGPEHQRHWAERVLRDASDTLRRSHLKLRIAADQVAEQPVPALLAAAGQSELLVLGSRGLSGLAGFLVGSVALSTVARAPRPVVLVRAGTAEEDEHLPDAGGKPSTRTPPRRGVLGLDPAHPSDPLVEFAFETAARRGAPLRVIHTWSLPPVYGYNPAIVEPGFHSEMQAGEVSALADALRPWREKFPDVQVTEQVIPGQAVHHLVAAASDAGLLVIGRRMRHSRAFGAHLGPVAHAVLHHAASPVAVVPYD